MAKPIGFEPITVHIRGCSIGYLFPELFSTNTSISLLYIIVHFELKLHFVANLGFEPRTFCF